jgi:general secretion pathway protein A
MYNGFFGLSRSPFAMTPDPRSLFLTDQHREALAGLSYAIVQQKGFAILEGQAGTGKTTLLRRLLEMLPQTEALVSFVVNPILSAEELLELLLIKFGVEDVPASKALRLTRLELLLLTAHKNGMVPVLIVDEAHKLNNDVLEEIRLLTNFENNDYKLLQIVLTGQPELRDVLNRKDLWQLKQRIAVRLHIDPLSPEQVKQYIQHRWTRADAITAPPFADDAIQLIALHSQGIPRLINSICDNSLLAAYSENSLAVTPQIVSEVVADLDLEVEPQAKLPSDRVLAIEKKALPVTASPLPAEPPRAETTDRQTPAETKAPLLGFWRTQKANQTPRTLKTWFINRIYDL